MKKKDILDGVFIGLGLAILSFLLCVIISTTAQAQERIKDRNGVVKYNLTTRNDGSVVVKDNSGRIVRIIREQNNGSTTYSDASGVVVAKEWNDDTKTVDSLDFRK